MDKLEQIAAHYEELEARLSSPDGDPSQIAALMKEYTALTPLYEKITLFRTASTEAAEALEMLDGEQDPEMKDFFRHAAAEADARAEALREEIRILMLPRDPRDEKNVIVEIRGGAGGEEAALFAGSLGRMYRMYAEKMGWKIEMITRNETELGGFKELSFTVEGKGAYSRLKFESGVHRVQRVPETVAVLPQADEVELEIDPKDLRIDTYRSSGAGGQHINKTESAIRITHLPTGMVVECQDERSQYKNKDKAMRVLRSRLLDMKVREQQGAIAAERKSQVGTGDRSERIRTYNFPQGRVTDHRIGLTLYKIDSFMDGALDEMIDALIADEQARLLAGETAE